jgi:hypothetical protein
LAYLIKAVGADWICIVSPDATLFTTSIFDIPRIRAEFFPARNLYFVTILDSAIKDFSTSLFHDPFTARYQEKVALQWAASLHTPKAHLHQP